MASSHVVIASASTTNSELPRRQSSICSLSTFLTDDEPQTLSSLTAMDDDHLFKNIQLYPEQSQLPELQPQPEAPFPVAGEDEVWAGVAAGGSDRRIDSGENGGVSEMTLDVFLMKNQLVREEDARVNPVGYGQYQMPSTQGAEGPMVVYGGNGSSGGASGRGKRRAVEEPLDKATEQKQRRMIKNRESAARSRERKQAYTVELETLVTQLEEENARLLREEAERTKERLKQLKENLVPVTEKKITRRVLRRVHSVQW